MTRTWVRIVVGTAIGIVGMGICVGQPTKEYIRLNGRVVAIENTASDAMIASDPVSEVFAGQQLNLMAKRASINQPLNVNWTAIPAGDGAFTTPLNNVATVTYVPPSSIPSPRVVTLRAIEPGSGRTLTKDITLKPTTVSVSVALAPGQTDIYQASGGSITTWQWAISPGPNSPAPVGQLQDVAGNPANQRRYVPPARNYCVQQVTITATAIQSGGSPAGAGITTRTLAKYDLANPMATSATDVVSGGAVELNAMLEGYNCQQPAQWVWSGPNVTSLGGGRYQFNAPAGLSSVTSFTLTATESNSGASGGVTVRAIPVGGAVLSASPNPIRLGPGAGQPVTATVNAANPTYSWTAGPNLSLSSSTGSTVCVSAAGSATGVSSINVSAPSSGAAGVTVPVTFVASGDTSGLQARVNLSPTGGALNLNGSLAFSATPANVCGNYMIDWTVTRRNSAGTDVVPAGNINNGVYTPPSPPLADGDLITVRAQLRGTSIFNTVGVVQSATGNSLTITPNPITISAGDSPVPLFPTITGTGIVPTTPVNWGVQPGGYGVIVTNLGVLYPPSFIDVPRDFVVRVTESSGNMRSGTATVRINGGCIPTIGLTASPSQLAPGDTTTLSVTNTCSGNPNYSYDFTPNTGSWNASTRQYTIPSNASAGSITARVTLLDSQGAASSFTASTTLTIALLPAVSINPQGPINIFPGQSQPFTVTVSNAANTGVSWAAAPAAPAGSGPSGNTYTFLGSLVAADQSHTLTATSLQDSSRTRTATIVQKAIAVNITGGPAVVNSGQTASYTATANFGGIVWSVTPTTYASIGASSGILTVVTGFSSAQNVVVRATSTVDPTKSATYGVTLNPLVAVSNIRPTLIYVKNIGTQMLADVSGTPNTALNWTMAEGAHFGSVTSSGIYTSYLFTTDNSNVTMTARSQADTSKQATQTVVIRQGISADSVTPSSGSGQTQTFSAAYTLRDTASTIDRAFLHIGADLNSPLCSVSYDRTNGNFYLWNDVTALLVPSGGSQSSGQCTLFSTGSSATYSNNVLTVNFRVTFNSNFGGAKQVYLSAAGIDNAWTGGRILKGTWTVPPPPITISISPSSQVTLQGGQSQIYTATASSGGLVWSKSTTLGTLSSSSGTTTTFTAPGSIAVAQYMTIRATSSIDATRWAEATIYLSSVPPPPTVTSITPVNGSGDEVAFTISATHPSGGQSISSVALGLGSSAATLGDPGTCTISLSRLSVEEWVAGINAYPPYYEYQVNWVGQSNSAPLTNGMCKAWGQSMSAGWAGGNNFSASMTVSFEPWYSGTVGVYGTVGSTWQYFGTWTKP